MKIAKLFFIDFKSSLIIHHTVRIVFIKLQLLRILLIRYYVFLLEYWKAYKNFVNVWNFKLFTQSKFKFNNFKLSWESHINITQKVSYYLLMLLKRIIGINNKLILVWNIQKLSKVSVLFCSHLFKRSFFYWIFWFSASLRKQLKRIHV